MSKSIFIALDALSNAVVLQVRDDDSQQATHACTADDQHFWVSLIIYFPLLCVLTFAFSIIAEYTKNNVIALSNPRGFASALYIHEKKV